MTDLLDVNLLISLAEPRPPLGGSCLVRWPRQPGLGHHACHRGWLRPGLIQQVGHPDSRHPGDARALLGHIRNVDGHVFFPDDVELVTGSEQALAQRLVGYRQVTDEHLLALARRLGARLATLDNAVRTLAGEDAADVLVVPMTAPASS